MQPSSEVRHSPHLLAVLTDESGQDMSEYAVLIGLVALVVVVAIFALGESITTVFDGIGTNLSKAEFP